MLTADESNSPVAERLNKKQCDPDCPYHQASGGYDLAPGNAHIAERYSATPPEHDMVCNRDVKILIMVRIVDSARHS